MRTARLARDFFGALVCVGILAMFAFQVFESVGMSVGIMPVTGIPLPFMSYGGSSMIATFACVGLAVLGRATAQAVPASPSTDPQLRINWNPVSETWRNLKLAHGNIVVFRSLLGISWMWFFGAAFLAQFPSFAKEVLHGDERVASLLLVVFSVGIGVGSLLCEVLSRRHVEIGLVPLGEEQLEIINY